jgi:membrane-associated protease RseP (regulator of RpoE activity)
VPPPKLSLVLFLLTFLSTTGVGAYVAGANPFVPSELLRGLSFSVPLLSILLAHELGHYIAARIHGVPVSLPLFVPFPIPPIGTMGAVIVMPDRIPRRDALFDIGAAGPWCGLIVALPVLAYGLAHSSVGPLPTGGFVQEGHSVLYSALLHWRMGGAENLDVSLNATAFAGWVGLLVTMLNLIPAAQLDGGHVAYALLGEWQERLSRGVRAALLPLGAAVSLYYGLTAFQAGARGDALRDALLPGFNWVVWWIVLRVLVRSGREHPPTDDDRLSPGRKLGAVLTLLLFVLLFMPAWLRQVH